MFKETTLQFTRLGSCFNMTPRDAMNMIILMNIIIVSKKVTFDKRDAGGDQISLVWPN